VQIYDPLATQVGINDTDRKAAIDKVRDSLTGTLNLERVIRSTRLGEHHHAQADGRGRCGSGQGHQDQRRSGQSVHDHRAFGLDALFRWRKRPPVARYRQKLIDIFREENQNGGQGEMKQTLQFLDQQLANRQGELQAAEQRRLAFESQHPELAQGGVSLIQRLEQSRASIRGLDADIAAAQSSLPPFRPRWPARPDRGRQWPDRRPAWSTGSGSVGSGDDARAV
jgi:hypothetical protein